jgi:hypothetical protein
MSVTALGAAAMMMGALSVAEFPAWLPGAQWLSPMPPSNSTIIVPTNHCLPNFEPSASGRCLPDCRGQGRCGRVRVAEQQQTIYGPDGRVQGRAVPQGEGSVRYYDARGTSLGTSTTTGSGTTFYGPGGNVIGRSSGPAPARPAFPGTK